MIDAKGHPDGLAVLSVLFQVDDQSAEAEEEPIEVPILSILTLGGSTVCKKRLFCFDSFPKSHLGMT